MKILIYSLNNENVGQMSKSCAKPVDKCLQVIRNIGVKEFSN